MLFKPSSRNDLIINKINNNKNINIYDYSNDKFIYKLISFKQIDDNILKEHIKNELKLFLNDQIVKSVLIVGLGNDNHTADSIGPKSLKHIKANAHLKKLGININNTVISLIEPGSLGETGIDASKIVEKVKDEVKPDLIIVIDAYIVDNFALLNKTIQITNEGIKPGSGIHGLNLEISYKTMKTPVIVIGVPSAIEIEIDNTNDTYYLCTKDIDTYVLKISNIIGNSLNELFYNL